MKNKYKLYYTILFCLTIFTVGLGTMYQSKGKIDQLISNSKRVDILDNRKNLTNIINDELLFRAGMIELYGLSQRLMLKNEIGNFDVIKDKNGFLHMQYTRKSDKEIAEWSLNLKELYGFVDARQIDFLFVQAPSDYLLGDTLPMGIEESTNLEIDMFHELLKKERIPFIDGRDLVDKLDGKPAFYKTDHHWTLELCFLTFQDIVSQLNSRYRLDIDHNGEIRDINNYVVEEYPKSLLGSTGIRTGKLYVGKDDFNIYIPKFTTELEYQHYVDGSLTKEAKGSFSEVFIDRTKLEKAYNNKYNAYLQGGWNENIVKNIELDSNKKILLIGDSFSRPLAQYLSLCFKELRYLDPQEGRYNESYAKYIESYNPDIVIMVINGAGIYYPLDLSEK